MILRYRLISHQFFLDDKSRHVTVPSQLAWYSRKIRGITYIANSLKRDHEAT